MRIRAFNGGDFDPLAKMIGSGWYAEQGTHALWCGADELCAHLMRSDVGFAAVDDEGSLVGALLLGSPRAEDHNAEMRRHWRQQRATMAAVAGALGVDAKVGAALLDEEKALLDEVIRERGAEGVGEIVLIFVAEGHRRQGIGAALLRAGLAWFAERELTLVCLVTDDGCDWQTYETLGMQLVAKRPASSGPDTSLYVYEQDLATLVGRLAEGDGASGAAAGAELVLEEGGDEVDGQVGALLDAFSEGQGRPMRWYRYRIREGKETVAGITAWAMGPDLHIDMLAVEEGHRKLGLGGRLLAEVERHAREDGCTSASVDTFSFQAPEYYPRHGFVELFRYPIDDGTERIYFSKRL